MRFLEAIKFSFSACMITMSGESQLNAIKSIDDAFNRLRKSVGDEKANEVFSTIKSMAETRGISWQQIIEYLDEVNDFNKRSNIV